MWSTTCSAAPRNKDLDEAPSRRNYVFLSAGTGVYTGNMGDGGSIGRRLTLPTDIGYGHWFSSLSGIQVALGNTLVPSPNLGSKTLTALRADYMMNLKSAVTGELPTTNWCSSRVCWVPRWQ